MRQLPADVPAKAAFAQAVMDARDGVTDPGELAGDFQIVFCSTCLNGPRVNCCILWPWRARVHLALLSLGDDREPLAELLRRFSAAVEAGLLLVASGSDYGLEVQGRSLAAAPSRAGPAAGEAGVTMSAELLTTWHASKAKNAAHLFGLWVTDADARTVLVNLDVDNIMTRDFVRHVATYMDMSPPCGIALCGGNVNGGLTGRMAYRAADFLEARGYDEDSFPSGGQDVDLRQRWKISAQWPAWWPPTASRAARPCAAAACRTAATASGRTAAWRRSAM